MRPGPAARDTPGPHRIARPTETRSGAFFLGPPTRPSRASKVYKRGMDLSPLEQQGMRVSTAALDRTAARRDLWPRNTLRLAQGERTAQPAGICWPRTRGEVAAALQFARDRDLAVIPYGAGSGVCGAAAGREGALVIDTKRMNRVLAIDPDRRVAHLQPGLLGQHMEDQLAQHGWMTAHSPSSIMCSTVGGYVAARSAGQFSSRYGVFDDMVLATAAAAPTGQIRTGVWTPRTTEDLGPVLAGSEGALAVVTDVLVRLVPLPSTRWFRAFAFPNLDAAWRAMRLLMQSDLWPSVVRLYDPLDTRIGGPARASRKAEREGGPSVWSQLAAAVRARPALQRHLSELPLALPKLVNRLADRVGDEVLAVVGFEGSDAQVAASVSAAMPILATGRDLGPEPGEHWFAHRHDVSYKLAPIFAGGAWADTMEVAAPWSKLGALHRGVRAALGTHALVMAHFSHAYPEGCSIYFSFAGRGDLGVYDATWTAALAAAREAGGTVTHHHGVGPLKMAEAAREQGAAVRVWREIKAALDPEGIMNPGRLFPEDVPEIPGPPPPVGGPVFSLDAESRVAGVDPHVPISKIEAELATRGHGLAIRPDRPLGDWLGRLERGALLPWQIPCLGVQARFADGVSAQIGSWPRSAAGPDLRPGLLRRAQAELVEVPVRPTADDPIYAVRRACPGHPEDLRPAFVEGERWGFAGPSAQARAELSEGEATRGGVPKKRPTGPRWPVPDALEAPQE